MLELQPSSATFPAARCAACETLVLTHIAMGDDGVVDRLCVRCDGPIQVDLTWLSAGELAENGYQIEVPRRARAGGEAAAGGGCGGGCSCSAKKN